MPFIYLVLITVLCPRHLQSKNIGPSAKFEENLGLIGTTSRRPVTILHGKTKLHMALPLDIHNGGQSSE
jgi:hypothetical protein